MSVQLDEADDIFTILVATDSHLGFMEKHGIRGDDSFIAFEEMLKLAVNHNVDFILLGGDLFHDNKPSKSCIAKCIRLLKKYCLGDREIKFQYLSDPSVDFRIHDPQVNYLDQNLNIGFPIFSIHGNHDDLGGVGDAAALDILAEAGLVNYFGRCSDYRNIQLSPILLKKNNTKLALYGLSNMKDERLYRLLRNGSVSLLREKEETDKWFNLLVIHQNRAKHSPKNYIPVEFFEDFIDLIVWGHEHENRLIPERCVKPDLYVTQPGSSVATSLTEGEAKPKSVGLLRVRSDRSFQMHELRLRTVRPFIFKTISLADNFTTSTSVSAIEDWLYDEAQELLHGQQMSQLVSDDPKQPKLPLLRMRVEYACESHCLQAQRFGNRLVGQVANPEDVLLMRPQKKSLKGRLRNSNDNETSVIERADDEKVEDFVDKFLIRDLSFLNEKSLTESLRHFLYKGNNSSFSVLVNHEIKQTVNHLLEMDMLEINEESVIEQIGLRNQQLVSHSGTSEDHYTQQTRKLLDESSVTFSQSKRVFDDFSDDDEIMEISVDKSTVASKGRSRSIRRASTSRGAGRARATRSRARSTNSRSNARNVSAGTSLTSSTQFPNTERTSSSGLLFSTEYSD